MDVQKAYNEALCTYVEARLKEEQHKELLEQVLKLAKMVEEMTGETQDVELAITNTKRAYL
jgi:hypothetical protein